MIPIWCSTCFAAAISPPFTFLLPPASTSRAAALSSPAGQHSHDAVMACRPSFSAIACVSVPDCSPPAGYSGLPPCRSTALSPFSDSTPCFYSFPWPNKSRPSKTNSNGARKTILASLASARTPASARSLLRRGPCARSRHAFRPRTPRRRLLRPRSSRTLQRRHPALRPHLQTGQPPASLSAHRGRSQRHPQRRRSSPVLLPPPGSQEFFRCHRRRGP